MSQPSTLLKLAELSRQKMDVLAGELAQLQQQCKSAEDKLGLLRQYAEEYRARLHQRRASGVAVGTLLEYQGFLKQLETVVQMQAREVERHRRFHAEVLQAWLAVRRQMRGFEMLAARSEAAAHLGELRRAQKEMDEFAARARSLLSGLA
ncbi:MAG: flagellar export protein FliJ [Pseudomonadota bacterium]